jgi:hypothetical protein
MARTSPRLKPGYSAGIELDVGEAAQVEVLAEETLDGGPGAGGGQQAAGLGLQRVRRAEFAAIGGVEQHVVRAGLGEKERQPRGHLMGRVAQRRPSPPGTGSPTSPR